MVRRSFDVGLEISTVLRPSGRRRYDYSDWAVKLYSS
jgi:hypothetical protein